MLNLSPIELARQQASRAVGGNNAPMNFLKLEDGVPKTIRLLNAFVPVYQFSHSCGMSHVDVNKAAFDAAMQSGNIYPCPNCGEPLTAEFIECERPEVIGAYMHRFIQTSDANKKANFVCIGHPQNAQLDIVENDGGRPKYECPICATAGANGKPNAPTFRLYGIAVEREPKTEMRVVNGIKMPVVTGTSDVMEADENGNMRPRIVIVDLPYQSFWAKLADMSPDFSVSITYFDWQIVRTGSGLDTKYTVNRLNDTPIVSDYRQYAEFVPDIRGILRSWGKPKFYNDKGWGIKGYVQEQPSPAASAQASVNNVAQFAAAPPVMAVGTPWSQISQMINGQR